MRSQSEIQHRVARIALGASVEAAPFGSKSLLEQGAFVSEHLGRLFSV